HPPTIVLFTNGPELFDDTYTRYLTKVLRESFPFPEVAINLVLRAKGEAAAKASIPDGVEAAEPAEEIPVVRKLPERKKPPRPPEPPKPRKKKPTESETWDL